MLSYPLSPMGYDLPFFPGMPTGSIQEMDTSHLDPKTAIFQQVKQSRVSTHPPPSLKDKLKGSQPKEGQPPDKTQLGKEIKQEVTNAENTAHNLKLLQETAEKSSTTFTVASFVQYWIADVVLKGGALAAQAGIPFLLETPTDSVHGLIPATEFIKFVTDVIDFGTGIVSTLHKEELLATAKVELNNLRTRTPPLEPDQLARLEKLEKIIQYESSLMAVESTEQKIRSVKNFFSYLTFLTSWAGNNPLAQSVSSGANTLMMGVNAALFGLFFYRAHKNLKTHREWSRDFKAWMKDQTLFVDKTVSQIPELLTETKKKIGQLLTKRSKRHDLQLQNIKERLQKKEVTIDSIQTKIIAIKQPVLQKFLHDLHIEDTTPETFQKRLEEKLGAKLDLATANALRNTSLNLREIRQSTSLSTQNKKEEMEKIKGQILDLEKKCLQTWIDQQSEDSLLSSYIDYHSVLDPTIKQSLAEMVKKKHKIEKSFLKMKKTQAGLNFTAATIIFGVALALAIIALVANPIGAAALIITCLTIGSVLLSLGLTGAGFYQAYRLKPGITAATLKGAYVRLYYYYARGALSSLKEKIGNYIKVTWQQKRDRLATFIDKLPLISRLSSKKQKHPEVELQDSALLKESKEKAEADFQQSRTKSQEWALRAETLKNELEEIAWKDFAEKAQLQVASDQKDVAQEEQPFDTLETLSHALANCDVSLLSPETKELIEKQLGVDINSLQYEIKKNPLAIKQMLREFFNMNEAAFVQFVGQQQFIKLQQTVNA